MRTGSPYAVAPDRVKNGSGVAVQGLHAVLQGWAEHGWREPVEAPTGRELAVAGRRPWTCPRTELPAGIELPEAGEAAALRRWRAYVEERLTDYDDDRDRPDLDATSRMSVHLKWGEIHPRTMLADLKGRRSQGALAYRRELAFREFYADVLFAQPRHRPGVPPPRVRAHAVRRAG